MKRERAGERRKRGEREEEREKKTEGGESLLATEIPSRERERKGEERVS